MIVLGCTGSIGVNTLKIAKKFNLKIDVLVAGSNIKLLNQQLKDFSPSQVIIQNKEDIKDVNHPNVSFGQEAILNSIKDTNCTLVVNALVGFFGLAPTIEAIKCGKKVALANKESLVVCGEFIDTNMIFPIDSEHFGLWYLLHDNSKAVNSLMVTASGGSFRDYPLEKLKDVTIKQALCHPNWSMGNKITIDSATMVNKLFELLEAKWLFDTTKIDAIIETKSIIHAMVNFTDGSTTAHISNPCMTLPISYALLGKVDEQIIPNVDFKQLQGLEFTQIDTNRYKIWEIKDELLNNSHLGVILNATNDIAVAKFLKNEIGFLDISNMLLNAINRYHNHKANSISDVFEITKEINLFYSSESNI